MNKETDGDINKINLNKFNLINADQNDYKTFLNEETAKQVRPHKTEVKMNNEKEQKLIILKPLFIRKHYNEW